MKRILLLCVLMTFLYQTKAQTNLNAYKYAVVPLQYEFLKGKDTYRLNTLTRVLFKSEGFKTYFTEEQLPEDLFKDRCLALYPDVKKVGGGPFKKKVQIIIKDCSGNIIHESEIGDSKENNHQKAYNEALRKAFKSIEKLNYNYKPEENQKEEDKIQKEETLETKKEEKVTQVIKPVKKDKEVKKSKPEKVKSVEDNLVVNNADDKSLKAESISLGYKLLDAENNSVIILLNTASENVFIVKGEDAIVFKKGNKWMYSKNDGKQMVLKELNIKF